MAASAVFLSLAPAGAAVRSGRGLAAASEMGAKANTGWHVYTCYFVTLSAGDVVVRAEPGKGRDTFKVVSGRPGVCKPGSRRALK